MDFKCKKIYTILKLIPHETYYLKKWILVSQNSTCNRDRNGNPGKIWGMLRLEELESIARPEKGVRIGEGIAQKIANMSLNKEWCFI